MRTLTMSRRALLGAAIVAAAQPPARSAPYLGQKPPGKTPELFAPGLVNTGLATRDVAMTPDGSEFYFRVGLPMFSRSAIVGSRLENGRWTAPEVAPFAADPRWRTLEPCISPDGARFFFVSDRPAAAGVDKPGPMGIWVMERTPKGWGEQQRLPEPVNGKEDCFFPSVTQDGTLYFCRDGSDGMGVILRARREGGGYAIPEKLPAQVNCGQGRYNAFVAPDESFVILAALGRPDSVGGVDYHIVFRRPDDVWSEAIDLGAPVNTPGSGEYSAFVTRDGTFLFFSSSRTRPDVFAPGEKLTLAKLKSLAMQPDANGDLAIYWVDASFLGDLRKKAVFPK